jgi:hypothetical protein
MNVRCENCGRAALDSDETCWHCGAPLPGREGAGRKLVKARESWAHGAGPASIAVFGGLTLMVVLAAILVMVSLGRRPQLQVLLGTRSLPGWRFVTAADQAFTLALPGGWTWLDGASAESAATLAALVEDEPRFLLATHPLGAESDDVHIVFAAADPLPGLGEKANLVVAASPLLNRLTYQEATSFLTGSDYDVLSARFVDDFDKSRVDIVVDTPLVNAPLVDGRPDSVPPDGAAEEGGEGLVMRCRQQFVLGREQSLLVSLCAPRGRFAVYSQTFDNVMASFQHLDTP